MQRPPPPPEIHEQLGLFQRERLRWLKVAASVTLAVWAGLLWWAREDPALYHQRGD